MDAALTYGLILFTVSVGLCSRCAFSPGSNITCNMILAVVSLALARRKQGDERQLLRWLGSICISGFGRDSLCPKENWTVQIGCTWKVMEKLKVRHCVQVNMHKAVMEGLTGEWVLTGLKMLVFFHSKWLLRVIRSTCPADVSICVCYFSAGVYCDKIE